MHRSTLLLPCLLALGMAAGCAPPKTAGQRGALAFGIDGADLRSPEPLVASLAEGEAVDLVVYTPERLEADGSHITTTPDGQRRLSGSNVRTVDVARAQSLSPEVLEVVAIDGPRVTVRGLSAGVARLQVETWVGTDFIEVEVEPLGYVELDHHAGRCRAVARRVPFCWPGAR